MVWVMPSVLPSSEAIVDLPIPEALPTRITYGFFKENQLQSFMAIQLKPLSNLFIYMVAITVRLCGTIILGFF